MTLSSNLVAVVDWTRDPQPKTLVRFSIPGVSSGSANGKPGLTDTDSLRWQLETLGSTGCGWVEIENYLEERAIVTPSKSGLAIEKLDCDLEKRDGSVEQVMAWAEGFLRGTFDT